MLEHSFSISNIPKEKNPSSEHGLVLVSFKSVNPKFSIFLFFPISVPSPIKFTSIVLLVILSELFLNFRSIILSILIFASTKTPKSFCLISNSILFNSTILFWTLVNSGIFKPLIFCSSL